MPNIKLLFFGSEESQTQKHQLECYQNHNNNIYLNIDTFGWDSSFICLDKSTAIKLHRELKKQISFLKDE
jgi:hypothetical protein